MSLGATYLPSLPPSRRACEIAVSRTLFLRMIYFAYLFFSSHSWRLFFSSWCCRQSTSFSAAVMSGLMNIFLIPSTWTRFLAFLISSRFVFPPLNLTFMGLGADPCVGFIRVNSSMLNLMLRPFAQIFFISCKSYLTVDSWSSESEKMAQCFLVSLSFTSFVAITRAWALYSKFLLI